MRCVVRWSHATNATDDQLELLIVVSGIGQAVLPVYGSHCVDVYTDG